MKSPLINDLDFLTTLMVDLPNTRILFLTVTVDNFVNESNKLYKYRSRHSETLIHIVYLSIPAVY